MLPLLALAAAATAPAPAPVPDAVRPALRCVIVSLAMFGSGDAGVQSAGLMASLYWFGRLDGHCSDADLTRWLQSERTRMTQADAQLDGKRCGDEMQRRGAALQAIGKAIGDGDAKAESQ